MVMCSTRSQTKLEITYANFTDVYVSVTIAIIKDSLMDFLWYLDKVVNIMSEKSNSITSLLHNIT